MKILLGQTGKLDFVSEIRRLGWGRMSVRDKPNPYPGEPWGFDNGAYMAWIRKLPFPEDNFLKRLDKAFRVGTPYLAVCPDLVARGQMSLDFSLSWLPRLPQEWPWYLAVQDGMTWNDVEPVIDKFAGLFLGGSDEFKRTAWNWRVLSLNYGKKFHYGRAGVDRKVDHARWCNADSLDSTYPLWEKSRFERFVDRMEKPIEPMHPSFFEPEECYVTG
jgi:hypothetical protein